MSSIIMKQIFNPGEERVVIGNAIYGAINLDPVQIKSIYDLMSVQIPVSALDRVETPLLDHGIDTSVEAAQINLWTTEIKEQGRWRIVMYLPHLVDLSLVPYQTLQIFLDECVEHKETYGWVLDNVLDDEDKGDIIGQEDAYTQEENVIDLIQQLLAKKLTGYVYLIKSASGYWKIGRTVNPDDRIKTFSVKLPFEVEYEHLIPCGDHVKAEAELHKRFASKRSNGEWFCLDETDIAWIKAIKSL
jgi:hypothetical protein